MLLSTRRLVRAVFALFGILFSVAAQFVLLGSGFLGAAQVIIYIGGILVLIIFGIMLTGRFGLYLKTPQTQVVNLLPGILIGFGLLLGLTFLLSPLLETGGAVNYISAESIGQQLLTTYLPVFEWASVLLLVALVVAAYFMREPKSLVTKPLKN